MPEVIVHGDAISCGDTAVGHSLFTINGAAIVVDGDLSAGHAGFPPTPISAKNKLFTVNGKAVALAGDLYAPHSDGEDTHSVRRAIGSVPFDVVV